MVYFCCTSAKWACGFMSSGAGSCSGREDGSESQQEHAPLPPNPSLPQGTSPTFPGCLENRKQMKGQCDHSCLAKWSETPCFYSLTYPIPCSGCSMLSLFHLTRIRLSCQPCRHPPPQPHEYLPGSHWRGAAGSSACWDLEWYPSSWHKCIPQAAALLLLADTCRRNPLYLWLVFSSLPVKAV